jgi:hypothetical protein
MGFYRPTCQCRVQSTSKSNSWNTNLFLYFSDIRLNKPKGWKILLFFIRPNNPSNRLWAGVGPSVQNWRAHMQQSWSHVSRFFFINILLSMLFLSHFQTISFPFRACDPRYALDQFSSPNGHLPATSARLSWYVLSRPIMMVQHRRGILEAIPTRKIGVHASTKVQCACPMQVLVN